MIDVYRQTPYGFCFYLWTPESLAVLLGLMYFSKFYWHKIVGLFSLSFCLLVRFYQSALGLYYIRSLSFQSRKKKTELLMLVTFFLLSQLSFKINYLLVINNLCSLVLEILLGSYLRKHVSCPASKLHCSYMLLVLFKHITYNLLKLWSQTDEEWICFDSVKPSPLLSVTTY